MKRVRLTVIGVCFTFGSISGFSSPVLSPWQVKEMGPNPREVLLGDRVGPHPTDTKGRAGGASGRERERISEISRRLEEWDKRLAILDAARISDPKPGRLGTVLRTLLRMKREVQLDFNRMSTSGTKRQAQLKTRIDSTLAEMDRLHDQVSLGD